MASSTPRIAFLKLIVSDLAASARFYAAALGFSEQMRFNTADFEEVVLIQEDVAFQLMLLRWHDGRQAGGARLHGPTGFICDDIVAAIARCVAAGAIDKSGVIELDGGVKVALLDDPEGHEIELVQFG
jgi:lactoylglutathione lyase